MFCGNSNNCLWIILILIVIFACGGNSWGNGCSCGGNCNCSCSCNNDCSCNCC